MIARGSMRVLRFLLRVGYHAGLHPWVWDEPKCRLVLLQRKGYLQFLNSSTGVQIVSRTTVVIYILLWTCIFGGDLGTVELMLYLTVSAMQTSTVVYLFVWTAVGQVWTNSLLLFNHKMKLFCFHIPECPFYKDGVESFILFLMTIVPVVFFFLIVSVTICLTQYDVNILRWFTLFLNSSPMALIVGVIVLSCALATDVFIAALLILLTLIHVNTLSSWLSTLKWTSSNLRRRDFRATQRTYRAIYVFHDFVNMDFTGRVISISILAASALMTTSLFLCFVKLEDPAMVVFRLIGLQVFGGIVFVTNKLLDMCCGVNSDSTQFITTISQPQFARNKFIRLHVKSCQPLTWNASPLVINKFTILQILANVINIVITLLLNTS